MDKYDCSDEEDEQNSEIEKDPYMVEVDLMLKELEECRWLRPPTTGTFEPVSYA